MAKRIDEESHGLPTGRATRALFGQLYPNFAEWLDGSTWELDLQEDLKGANLNGFRSNLHYQARAMQLNLTTKTVRHLDEQGRMCQYLLVRAW